MCILYLLQPFTHCCSKFCSQLLICFYLTVKKMMGLNEPQRPDPYDPGSNIWSKRQSNFTTCLANTGNPYSRDTEQISAPKTSFKAINQNKKNLFIIEFELNRIYFRTSLNSTVNHALILLMSQIVSFICSR